MIQESFIFLDGFAEKSEQNLWKQGITDWQKFTGTASIKGVSPSRKAFYDLQLEKAHKNLQVDNLDYLSSVFPSTEHFRFFNRYKDEAAYLDIETSNYDGDVTVVGIYDSNQSMTFVKGKNLDRNLLQSILDKYKMLITFNGASFDLPMIKKYFNVQMPKAHIDLRHVCSRLGLTGGLKVIEKEMGIVRDQQVQGITGGDAALLWRKYKATGNENFLKLLVMYNEEDTVNLERLAKRTIPKLWQLMREGTQTPPEVPTPQPVAAPFPAERML